MIPKSIGIIPDGNRRLAKRMLKEPWKGHEMGIGKLYNVLDWCIGLGIKNVTFYSLSLENIEKRPDKELHYLFLLAKNELDQVINDKNHFVHKNNVKMTFFGKLDVLPKELQQKISEVTQLTKDYESYTLNLAIAYGGRQEIVNTAKILSEKYKSGEIIEINEENFKKNLYTNGYGDPDLIIRTGGERRLSNFLLFQSAYSELSFVDTFWPEIEKQQFLKIINDFSERDRRFGK